MNGGSVSEVTGDPALDDALGRLSQAVADLTAFDLTSLVGIDGPSVGLHAAARAVEDCRRQLTMFDAGYVEAVEVGDEPRRFACASTAVFLRDQLRLSHREARQRVLLAHACRPRRGLSGEQLPALMPLVAEAMARGRISADHASTVLAVLDSMPDTMRADHGGLVEAELVRAAREVGPADRDRLGQQLIARFDPDGVLRDVEFAHAHRELRLVRHRLRPGARLVGELDAELTEKIQVVLDAGSKPVPDGPDGRDPRSHAARQHDALLDAVDHVLASGDLPACGGTPASLVFVVPVDQLEKDCGLAVSDNGTLVPVNDAVRMADQSLVHTLVTSSTGVPLWLGRTSRIASPGQTVALSVRDRGCSFPGCDRPPSYCQRHHVTEWVDRLGPTDIDNLTLLCGFHHREFARRGWRVVMTQGLPSWIPPIWLDPHQRPLRNHAHQRVPDTG